jgi:quercetin dioxygenase-like cupin family protein
MKKIIVFATFSAFLLVSCSSNTGSSKEENPQLNEQEITSLKIENLLRDSLDLTEGVEVVMSYLEMPKETTLPTHYHPGEEFVYILHGSGELSLKDQSKIIVKAGDVVKVPLKHVHSFSTLNEDVKAVVFRVHEKGQPDRILIEDD